MNSSISIDFDFISDEEFRTSLSNDYKELKACDEADSWKAIYVLAGSIVEALLIEHLVISGIRPNGKDPLVIDLATAVEACRLDGVIQEETASLCTVIRGYRNLIHPGRVIRLGQSVSPEGAQIAISLVSLIAKEVSERRKLNYGQTAEQIVKKIRSDQHSLILLPELLAETKEHERVKLVERSIIEAYAAEEGFIPDEAVLERLRLSYRQVLEGLPESIQRKIAEKFAKSIRNDSIEKIQSYGDCFFLAKDIALLQPKDALVVTKHLLTRLDDTTGGVSDKFLNSLIGIGQFVPIHEASGFADVLIKLARRKNTNQIEVMNFVTSEYDNVPDEKAREKMTKRVGVWIEFAKSRGYSEESTKTIQRIADLWYDVPF